MASAGYHLTPIGGGDFLLEPARSLDIGDHDALVEGILTRLQNARSTRLFYDLAELQIIEPRYYDWLNTLARGCQAINVRMVCIHMQPTAAFTLSQFMTASPDFETARDVS